MQSCRLARVSGGGRAGGERGTGGWACMATPDAASPHASVAFKSQANTHSACAPPTQLPPCSLWHSACGALRLPALWLLTCSSFLFGPTPRSYRALLFVALGLWGLVPGLHAWVANAGESAFAQALALDLLMGAIYIVS